MEQVILGLEEQRWQAMQAADVVALDRLLSPSLNYTHSNLTSDSKDSYIAKVSEGYYRYLQVERQNEQARVVGTAAIVTGHLRASIIANGNPRTLNNLYLAVWVQEAGAWRFLAYQPTVVPNP